MGGNAMPEERVVVGNWIDAIGTITSVIAELKGLRVSTDIRHLLLLIGEGLQSVGSVLASPVGNDNTLNFVGSWIDNTGEAASALAGYLQYVDEENGVENIQLEGLGDGFQSLGSFMMAISNYESNEYSYAVGHGIQGLGAALEAVADVKILRNLEDIGQPLNLIGSILQAIGATLIAILSTSE